LSCFVPIEGVVTGLLLAAGGALLMQLLLIVVRVLLTVLLPRRSGKVVLGVLIIILRRTGRPTLARHARAEYIFRDMRQCRGFDVRTVRLVNA
jgi:hypothetical protein